MSRSIFLTFQDIANDEPFSIYHAQFSASTIIDQLKNYNNPPLFELVLHYWIKLFGISPLSVRTLPMLISAASSIALYMFAKKHFSMKIAILSSLFLSFSSLSIYYAQDCRAYSLFLLCTIFSMRYYLDLHFKFNFSSALLFILSTSALIYTHYFGFLVIAIQGLHLVLFKRNFLSLLLSYLIILITYIPHMIVIYERFSTSVNKGTWVKSPSGLESLYNMLWSFSNVPLLTVVFISLLLLSLFLLIKSGQLRKMHHTYVLLILWFLLPYLGLFIVSYKVPVYLSRYLIFALPGFYMLLAVLLESFPLKNTIKYSFISMILIVFAFTAEYKPNKKQGIKNAVDALILHRSSDDLVLICPYDFINTFAYHYNRKLFSTITDTSEYNLLITQLNKEHMYLVNNTADLDHLRNTIEHKRILYLESEAEFAMPGNGVRTYLMDHYEFKDTKTFNDQTFLHIMEHKK